MNEYLLTGDTRDEFWTDEKCFIEELCNDPKVPDASLAIARVQSGDTTQLHALKDITETYIVIEGLGRMEVSGKLFDIAAGDRILIPAGASQRVTATGSEDLRFYCLCTPAWKPDSYINLE